MRPDPFSKKIAALLLVTLLFFSGLPMSLIGRLSVAPGRIVDESVIGNNPFSLQSAEAAAKTKTIVFLVGSIVPTSATSTATGVTSTYNFTINLPDMVPTAQPIRSAYIVYNTWQNGTAGLTASAFTLAKATSSVQQLATPKLTSGSTNQQWLGIRLDATAAMRTLIGNVSGTYAMIFTAQLTGNTRIGEGAELYITYD